jgi:hypothetical protein
MSAKESILEQKREHQRRLHQLQLQQARYGISAEPHIYTQIEDIKKLIGNAETIAHSAGLIDIHRGTLAVLLKQRTHFGANVPPHVANQIASERQEIARLKRICTDYGYSILDHPVDADQSEVEAPEPTHAPYPPDPIALMRRRLRDIQALARFGDLERVITELEKLQRDIS